jgi:predicted nucleic acid-binding protein
MRLILDTNILLSVLPSPLGGSAKLIYAWERKVFTLGACEALIAELAPRGVLSRRLILNTSA